MSKSKVLTSLKEAIYESGLQDGMTISFHHHLRGGDYVLNMVMDEIAKLGFKNLTINASSIHDSHEPLIKHMANGVVTNLEANYIGPIVGKAISEGVLKNPAIFRTHGTRPSHIESGISKIDIAFLGAPTSDNMGNCTGKIGKSACGSLGYAFADAIHARKTVIITDNMVEYPLSEFSISEDVVDYVVNVDMIGDAAKIVSGTTQIPKDPIALKIADYAAKAIEASGFLKDGFSFQTGAGGSSLAVAKYLKDIMLKKQIKGSFALGGITGYIVDMLEAGCFKTIMDVQCFDLKSVESIRKNVKHTEITASHYASPTGKSTVASSLDAVVLGAAQIDTDFNVNVHTDSRGYIIGGSGGHSDVASCSKLTIIVAPLSRARIPIVVDKVLCLSTPGENVDLLVTQYGISINPKREDLKKKLQDSNLPIIEISELKRMVVEINGNPKQVKQNKDHVVANVLNRDGVVIDKIYKV